MNAQTFIERLSITEFREWFQAQVWRLRETEGPLSKVIGARLQYVIDTCECDDIMPQHTRKNLQEIAESVFFFELIEEPITYQQGAKLLRRCLRREGSH